ncbi:hypothetical protein BDW02DRAFT_273568 [Decorospora gaudefroyi]|uniref:Uncharacterized protein n=1 Tax=Decorospora gaudefroyi TaxID=184978 RepID=A0A6A5KYV9_9PLEO|nr:hypothetical protein BDW02DRAFT_273568 [Decorospora gaudefroyi]
MFFLDVYKRGYNKALSVSVRCVRVKVIVDVAGKDLFVFEETQFSGVRSFSSWYPWGGRDSVEQREVSPEKGEGGRHGEDVV